MTTEEKLQHFLDFCMEDARSRSAKMLDEYTAALEQTFAEHQADARRRAEQQVELESERIEHETNKKLSLEQIGIKRELGHKQEELKDKIFAGTVHGNSRIYTAFGEADPPRQRIRRK